MVPAAFEVPQPLYSTTSTTTTAGLPCFVTVCGVRRAASDDLAEPVLRILHRPAALGHLPFLLQNSTRI